MFMSSVVISRHPAAIAFLVDHFNDHGCSGWRYDAEQSLFVNDSISFTIPVIIGNATEDDVIGKHVFGNVPLNLACKAKSVTAIEFAGNPPRGREYTVEDMHNALAYMSTYEVRSI